MTDSSESGAAAGDVRPAGNSGPGALLRSARNARGLSRVEAAAALRLDESSIAALEEENFSRLGAPVFVRGHLRRYAELLGLPAQTLLDAYRAMGPHSEALPALPCRSEVRVVRRRGFPAWGVAGAVLLLIALLAWTGSQSYLTLSPAVAARPVPRSPVSVPQEAVSGALAAASPVIEESAPDPVPVSERAPEPLSGAQSAAPQQAAAPPAAVSVDTAATTAAPAAGDSGNAANGG